MRTADDFDHTTIDTKSRPKPWKLVRFDPESDGGSICLARSPTPEAALRSARVMLGGGDRGPVTLAPMADGRWFLVTVKGVARAAVVRTAKQTAAAVAMAGETLDVVVVPAPESRRRIPLLVLKRRDDDLSAAADAIRARMAAATETAKAASAAAVDEHVVAPAPAVPVQLGFPWCDTGPISRAVPAPPESQTRAKPSSSGPARIRVTRAELLAIIHGDRSSLRLTRSHGDVQVGDVLHLFEARKRGVKVRPARLTVAVRSVRAEKLSSVDPATMQREGVQEVLGGFAPAGSSGIEVYESPVAAYAAAWDRAHPWHERFDVGPETVVVDVEVVARSPGRRRAKAA